MVILRPVFARAYGLRADFYWTECTKIGTFRSREATEADSGKVLQDPRGREPVREWLKEQNAEDRKIIGTDIMDVEYAWPIGPPLVDNLGKGLWEVRSNLTNRIARVIFCIKGEQMILLHAFIKKTQKTPQQDIDLALERMRGEQ